MNDSACRRFTMDRRRPGLALALTASGLLLGCAPDDVPQKPTIRGADVFEVNCSPCHGADGRGPSLASIRALSAEDRRNAIRNHPTAGQIPQRLPTAELGELLNFFEAPPAE
jgi:mono/diheme cytochrome c family protein